MQINMQLVLCAVSVLFVVLSTGTGASVSSDPTWDYFVLSLQWPESTAIRYSADHKISIHKNVTTWSVHGLWPSHTDGTKGPYNCNSSWPFNMEEIDPILGVLLKFWPNVFDDGKKSIGDFWSHEWSKHGTCAAAVPKVRGERNYFGGAVQLLNKFSVDSGLKKSGIVPSDTKTYDYIDVEKAFDSYLQKKAHIQCFFKNKDHSNKEHHQYVGQVFICLDLNFGVIDCPQEKATKDTTLYFRSLQAPPLVTCQEKYPVMLPTIKYTYTDRYHN